MQTFFTLFLITTLQANVPGDRPLIHYDDIKTYDSRLGCEQARLAIMMKYQPPGPGVVLACIKTDEA
jgi:hypothetical protein